MYVPVQNDGISTWDVIHGAFILMQPLAILAFIFMAWEMIEKRRRTSGEKGKASPGAIRIDGDGKSLIVGPERIDRP